MRRSFSLPGTHSISKIPGAVLLAGLLGLWRSMPEPQLYGYHVFACLISVSLVSHISPYDGHRFLRTHFVLVFVLSAFILLLTFLFPLLFWIIPHHRSQCLFEKVLGFLHPFLRCQSLTSLPSVSVLGFCSMLNASSFHQHYMWFVQHYVWKWSQLKATSICDMPDTKKVWGKELLMVQHSIFPKMHLLCFIANKALAL